MQNWKVKYCDREGNWQFLTYVEVDPNGPPELLNEPAEWTRREAAFRDADEFKRENHKVDKVLIVAAP